jgi:hypothetical protein
MNTYSVRVFNADTLSEDTTRGLVTPCQWTAWNFYKMTIKALGTVDYVIVYTVPENK